MLISSQAYRNEEIVEEKRKNKDYKIYVTPEFTVNGVTYQAIVDGHHSYDAAELDGAKIEIEIYHEYDYQLNNNPIDFLEGYMIDTMWYNIDTFIDVDFS